MSDQPQQSQQQAVNAASPWKRRMIWGAFGGAFLVIAILVGMAWIPRWWSQRIGDQVDGSLPSGIGIGLFYGVTFTLLPLLALRLMFWRHKPWKYRLSMLALAAVLALPNLFTLGIVLGNGNGAHAAERTLDSKAPNFRASTLAGAIIAAVVFAGIMYLLMSRRRAKAREAELRGELKAREQAAKEHEAPPS